jgi:hypothetical protein
VQARKYWSTRERSSQRDFNFTINPLGDRGKSNSPYEEEADRRAPFVDLFLLLALGVCLIAVFMGGLRMLLRSGGVLLALGVVALAVMFRSGTVCLRCALMVLCGLVVLVSFHGRFLACCLLPVATEAFERQMVPSVACCQIEILLTRASRNSLSFAQSNPARILK